VLPSSGFLFQWSGFKTNYMWKSVDNKMVFPDVLVSASPTHL
jgi:hypothetical protein